ncbi:uncharacterized protein EV420DRAFT_1622243 [Desarmillaria tabescens]|uniref:Endonuclease/exonuclease/phosphatase domain-containing protein n=1 Tax=Armillaria tabescens TaxID=1929756 RepID=A0AA39JV76_ARMTA|nr:uncharacterized protein EV420DRAFT_1622243 [Desarmillaria tabescens]KAK0448485.1 hypothetical protein EV420DRAFT_1622243 [Desarmillaria tabescens]
MPLPAYIPTLWAFSTGNYIQVDNVFCSDELLPAFIKCTVDHAMQPPRTDHFPIISIIDITPPCNDFEPCRNFRKVEWPKFHETLETRLKDLPSPCEIRTKQQMYETLNRLDTIHVPWTKPSPYVKSLRKRLRQEEKRKLHNTYAEACWMEWLENAQSRSIWDVCSFISQPMSDGGRSRVPDLVVKREGQPIRRV